MRQRERGIAIRRKRRRDRNDKDRIERQCGVYFSFSFFFFFVFEQKRASSSLGEATFSREEKKNSLDGLVFEQQQLPAPSSRWRRRRREGGVIPTASEPPRRRARGRGCVRDAQRGGDPRGKTLKTGHRFRSIGFFAFSFSSFLTSHLFFLFSACL